MVLSGFVEQLRSETRKLRQDLATTTRAKTAHQQKAEKLTEEVITLKEKLAEREKTISTLENENADLKVQLTRITETAKKYAGMIFKSSVRHTKTGLPRGAQKGHTGTHRPAPSRIDAIARVAFTACPDCHTALKRTDSHDTRIVEDIPPAKTVVTQYEIERQWCTTCHKEVRALPQQTIPGFSIGLHTLTLILFLKYRLRTPLAQIVTLLASQYDLHITEGAIVNHLDACKARFGAEYTQILSEIRHAPVKHADETSWRIAGVNCWAWLFATPTAALYTIEENRGKEIPTRILGPTPTGLLVRDDFASYTALALPQQSCWSHLLRTSREHAEKDTASPEMGALHTELGSFFGALKDENEKPFVLKERIRVHQTFFTQITTLIAHTYVADDARAIQTRIRNQGKNLIEALLHEHAPLTNNHAERMIRPLVVTRKISGGSQSNKGAATHAVNMSIVQTLSLRGINLFEGMRDLIHAGNVRYVAGKG